MAEIQEIASALAEEVETTTGPRVIVLGGAAYHVVDFDQRMVIQDHYLQKWMRIIGFDKLLPAADEASTVFVVRVQSYIIDSNMAPHLLAGIIVPHEISVKEWDLKVASATAGKIAALDSPDDRDLVAQLCLEIAFAFFKQAIVKFARTQVALASVEHALDSKPTH